MPEFDTNELQWLKDERARVDGVIDAMKEKEESTLTLKRKREEDDEEARVLVVNSSAANTSVVKTKTKTAASSSLYLNQLVMYPLLHARLLVSVQTVAR